MLANSSAENYSLTYKKYFERVSKGEYGTYNSSLVGIREIMIRALLCGASNIIIIHNHPSGVSEPSKEDKAITEKLEKAAELIGIHFCDHIIIGRGNFFSFRKEKL